MVAGQCKVTRAARDCQEEEKIAVVRPLVPKRLTLPALWVLRSEDVVTRNTRPSMISPLQVEELEREGNPDEKDMDRYLKAHDDLQTVLRVYEGVLDGKNTLPLTNNLADLATGGARGPLGNGRCVDSSDDDEPLVSREVIRRAATAVVGQRSGEQSGGRGDDSGGRSSPATANLLDLDLEESAPLEAGAGVGGRASAGGGMLVAYNAGQFNANNARGASGSAAGFDSSSSAALGSTTPSNFPSETGAVFGSNPAGSSYGGGGDSGAGFGESARLFFLLSV